MAHDKGRDCPRTEQVLDNYRRRALAAERALHDLVDAVSLLRQVIEAAPLPPVHGDRDEWLSIYDDWQRMARRVAAGDD